MKVATGIVRRMDDLGRIVLPMELRRKLDISNDDYLEIFTDENGTIVLKKYTPGCTFCMNCDGIIQFQGKPVCQECVNKMSKLAIPTPYTSTINTTTGTPSIVFSTINSTGTIY